MPARKLEHVHELINEYERGLGAAAADSASDDTASNTADDEAEAWVGFVRFLFVAMDKFVWRRLANVFIRRGFWACAGIVMLL